MKIAVLYGNEVLLVDKGILEEMNIIVVETRFKVLIDGVVYTAYRHVDKGGLESINRIYNQLKCGIFSLKDKLVKQV